MHYLMMVFTVLGLCCSLQLKANEPLDTTQKDSFKDAKKVENTQGVKMERGYTFTPVKPPKMRQSKHFTTYASVNYMRRYFLVNYKENHEINSLWGGSETNLSTGYSGTSNGVSANLGFDFRRYSWLSVFFELDFAHGGMDLTKKRSKINDKKKIENLDINSYMLLIGIKIFGGDTTGEKLLYYGKWAILFSLENIGNYGTKEGDDILKLSDASKFLILGTSYELGVSYSIAENQQLDLFLGYYLALIIDGGNHHDMVMIEDDNGAYNTFTYTLEKSYNHYFMLGVRYNFSVL